MTEVLMHPVWLMLPSLFFLLLCAPVALEAMECETIAYQIDLRGFYTLEGDAMALAGDWRAVGGDMRRVLARTPR